MYGAKPSAWAFHCRVGEAGRSIVYPYFQTPTISPAAINLTTAIPEQVCARRVSPCNYEPTVVLNRQLQVLEAAVSTQR